MKNCPRCHLPELEDDDVLNALSHDGKTYVCSTCGKIESFEKLGLDAKAYGLKLAQRRSQAALYGLDENRNPKLPKEGDKP